MADVEELLGFAPPDFFFQEEQDLQFIAEEGQQLLSSKYLLAPLAEVMGQESYVKALMGWNYKGLAFQFEVTLENPLSVAFPEIQQGDAIELFIDTRALTSARTTHRFCHHFYFLPERFEGHEKGEITRFRTEDSHPLCSEEGLELQVTKRPKGYVAKMTIPRECLVGYDPQEGSRIGFTYRVRRTGGPTVPFGLANEHCRIEYLPYLWPTLRLVSTGKEKNK